MTTLHDRLLAAVQARRELAEAARQLGGTVPCATWTADQLLVMAGEIQLIQPNVWFGPEHVVAHIAANDPAQILRDTTAHLEILDMHRPVSMKVWEYAPQLDGLLVDYVCQHGSTTGGVLVQPIPWPCPDIEALATIYPEVTQ